MDFAFEKLDVYQRAVKFVGRIELLCESLKGKISYAVVDQLTRAALSVPLNIAEGNGRWHKNDKKRFRWIARGSTFEIVPIIKIMHRKGCLTDNAYHELYTELEIISKMLNNLIKSFENYEQKA